MADISTLPKPAQGWLGAAAPRHGRKERAAAWDRRGRLYTRPQRVNGHRYTRRDIAPLVEAGGWTR